MTSSGGVVPAFKPHRLSLMSSGGAPAALVPSSSSSTPPAVATSDSAALGVSLGKPVFALSDAKSAAEFNAYREHYRSFRVGKAHGAKGEVSQFAKPTSTPHIVPPFLTKLHDMVTSDTYADLIHWSKDGTAVVISNIKQFSEMVLPQYFKHSKFASFLRQLNMYNFYTTRQEPELREFKNPNFVRENVNLMSCIKRKRTQTKANKESNHANKRQRTGKGRGTGASAGAGTGAAASMSATKSAAAKRRAATAAAAKSSAASLRAFQEQERKLREQLNLAMGIANAARSKCTTLQRTVDESSRELALMHRKIDSMMHCIEQLCIAGGDATKSVYASLFGSTPSSPLHNLTEGNRVRNGSTDSHMASMSDFLFDSFYGEPEGLHPAPGTDNSHMGR